MPTPYFRGRSFTLYHGSCLRVLPELSASSVDMIFADPPYYLSNGGFTVSGGKRVAVDKGEWDRSSGVARDYEFHEAWIRECRRVLKPEGTLWVSGTYHSIYQCGHALQRAGYHILNDVVWWKPNASPNLSCRTLAASHETLIWAKKERSARHTFNYSLLKHGLWPEDSLKRYGKQMRSVWAVPPPRAREKASGRHPTQKPEALLERIILASTNLGDVVLDPFTGSSTTGIAACRFGRQFIGIDMSREFLDLSIRRFKASSKGEKAG